MTINHPDEIEIQAYVLGENLNPETTEHILSCKECALRADNYELLFKKISQQQAPVFTFNLNQLVMKKLPQPATKSSRSNILFIVLAGISLLAVSGLFYLTMPGISNIVSGLAPFFLYLVIAVAVLITMFLSFDMYRKYLYQINAINFYSKLQH